MESGAAGVEVVRPGGESALPGERVEQYAPCVVGRGGFRVGANGFGGHPRPQNARALYAHVP